MTKSAYQDERGEWIYPQMYYQDGKPVSKKKLLEQIYSNPVVKEAIKVNRYIGRLIEQASNQKCIRGYNANDTFFEYYKPQIVKLVGWEAFHKELRTVKHYDAVYDAIYDILPADEVDLYPEGIMPNGMYSPNLQEKYGEEYA